MPSYRSGSLVRALVLSLIAQVEARHNALHHGINARHIDPSTCACGPPGATGPAAVTVTETHTVTAPTVTVTQAPGPGSSAGNTVVSQPASVPTQIVYVTAGSTIKPETVTVTAPAAIVTETRTLYVTDGSTIPASTVFVTATATASPVVTTATIVQTQPPRTIYVRGSDTIVPTVVTVTESPTGHPAPITTITTTAAQETGSDSGYPTSSIVPPADHHCHKNGTCHNHPGTYSVTQIDLPTFCGISTVMETVHRTVTQTVYPSDPSAAPTLSSGGNSTVSVGGTGSPIMPVHTVIPPRLRDARFEEMRGHYY